MTVPGAPEAIAGDPREASESAEAGLWTVFVPNLPSERSASSDSKPRETLMMKLRKDKSAPVESETLRRVVSMPALTTKLRQITRAEEIQYHRKLQNVASSGQVFTKRKMT